MITSPRVVRVKVADLVASADGTLVTIGLGSCVAIVLHDVEARVGGLAHVLLPSATMSRDRTNPAKFPETAVPTLIADMRRLGAKRERLIARIIGGASMFGNLLATRGINIGERNVAAVRTVLAAERVPIVAEDVGSDYGRSVYLSVEDGRVEVRSIRMGTRAL
jgi:chemotaxis protein CheD